MTVVEIAEDAMDRLHLTSDAARTRIIRNLNTRYRQLTSSIGLIPTRRATATATASIGDRNLTFTNMERLDTVYRTVGARDLIIDQITHDEMLVEPLVSEPPDRWSLYGTTYNSVTIRMNCTPTTAFTLNADGMQTVTSLAGNDRPLFAESFHDALLRGVMADEYEKMEKERLMLKAENDYEVRVSDLRMFLAKSAYMDLHDGKLKERSAWWDTRYTFLR